MSSESAESESGSSESRRKRGRALVRSVLRVCLLVWVGGKIAGCALLLPQPSGPEIRGVLPHGGYVVYQQHPRGSRESDGELICVKADGSMKQYWVHVGHAGPAYVAIRLEQGGKGLWVEAGGVVVASIDLTSGDNYYQWAQYGKGRVLAEGRTWSILEILVPW